MPDTKRPKVKPLTELTVTVDLKAVAIAVTEGEPRVLVVRRQGSRGGASAWEDDALPAGPLEARHRTLEAGLRSWVEDQTRIKLGYVEQLYTFGDRDREVPDGAGGSRILSIGYLALTRETPTPEESGAIWEGWYSYFPWEDWRDGKPRIVGRIARELAGWVKAAPSREARQARQLRLELTFGLESAGWNDEHVLDRYELLYEVGLVPEAHRDRTPRWAAADAVLAEARPMAADHRRILATAIARLRGKIKYRPVVFELLPPSFTLLQFQRAVEALAGIRLHKQNFRRLVENQGLVEETGAVDAGTGGRPAKLVRFRRDVVLERPAPGVRLPSRRASF